ncbi:MAG: hypothetical protein P4L86_26015 [Mycobacterium sp.]|nr:hypothetical protein [Mycobacterium sp.]
MIVGASARIGHWALRAQGFALGIFGGAGLAWTMANPQFGAAGAPIMWLRVTPLHCALLLGVGVLTIFASFGRAAVVFSRIAAIGWLIVTAICIMATASHTPGPLGFDAQDSVLYSILTIYNAALATWFSVRLGRKKTSVPNDRSAGRLHGHNSDVISTR